jgi:hypothetical protein
VADTVQNLVDDVRVEGGFDVLEATALRWLNRAWRRMTSEARAYRKTVTVGTTAVGTAFYAFSPIEAYSFEVGGVPYAAGARRSDRYASSQGTLWISPDGSGLVSGDADSTGAKGITLVPTPSTAGLAITSFAAVMPADLTIDATGNTLLAAVLEGDFHDGLVAGAVATGLKRLERRADEAGPFDQDFAVETERLKRRTRTRYAGAGPAQIRIQGVNA